MAKDKSQQQKQPEPEAKNNPDSSTQEPDAVTAGITDAVNKAVGGQNASAPLPVPKQAAPGDYLDLAAEHLQGAIAAVKCINTKPMRNENPFYVLNKYLADAMAAVKQCKSENNL